MVVVIVRGNKHLTLRFSVKCVARVCERAAEGIITHVMQSAVLGDAFSEDH